MLQAKQGDVNIYKKTLYSSHNRPLHYQHVFFSHPNENGLLVFVVLMLQSSNIASIYGFIYYLVPYTNDCQIPIY